MKPLLLILLGLLLLPFSPQARTIWPDTLDTRDSTAYYIAKIDSVIVGNSINGDVATVQKRHDTTMARKIAISVHFDRVLVSPYDGGALINFFKGATGNDSLVAVGIKILPSGAPPKKKQ